MSTARAQSKREKCKYKRCMSKRFYPVDKPRYCGKHVDKIIVVPLNKEVLFTSPIRVKKDETIEFIGRSKVKLSLKERIKSFIFVQK